MSSTLTVRALYPADDVVQAFGDFAAVLAWSKAKEEDLQFVLGLIGDETMDDFMELASRGGKGDLDRFLMLGAALSLLASLGNVIVLPGTVPLLLERREGDTGVLGL